ncbi:MAG: Transketolase 1 [Rhodospirillaceae bacterium]|nr:MAG: Transketolase 1 [Rhodospirillaceae bacterium]
MANLPSSMMANAIRALAMDAVEAAKSGHPGMPMGMADAATVLFSNHLKFDAEHPDWPDRDRFVLSAGHGSMLLYALLYLTGYKGTSLDALRNFRQLGSATAGHPEYGHAAGIETTTGPLGQGIANAVGMAMAEMHLRAKFGDALVSHHTYVIAGDGCLMEGISHEAASMAGHFGLGQLIVLFDDNGISIDGKTELTVSDDISARFTAYGWQVLDCDGHDMQDVDKAITAAKADTAKPSLIRCKTVIGKGAPTVSGTSKVHGAPLGAEEIAGTRKAIGWSHAPFEIPEDILGNWRKIGNHGQKARGDWTQRLETSAKKEAFLAALSGDISDAAATAVQKMKTELAANPQKVASRVASQKTIEALVAETQLLFGGSADLTGSNNTKAADQDIFSRQNPAGHYIHYGVREHGMAAAMNGIALHGGVVPYGGTFLVFTDYCRPSIRLSALMEQRAIYVMTHDSIGLGEDGPTHQPVEHFAALRAIPNLNLFRPCDIVETAEAWQIGLDTHNTPSILALSRQGLPQMRLGEDIAENKSMRGGYVLREASAAAEIVLMATGSEVMIAEEARQQLEASGHPTRLVSVPCMDILIHQDADYRASLLAGAKSIVVVEAGIEMGWAHVAGPDFSFVGMRSFGASAPADALFQHFGITAEAVTKAALAKLD